MSNTIKLALNDDGTLGFSTETPLAIDELISILMTVCLGAMNNVVDDAPEGHETECRGVLYDFFNVAASNLLARFAPELELRPNLTALAIKEAEDRIILEGRLGEVAQGT